MLIFLYFSCVFDVPVWLCVSKRINLVYLFINYKIKL